MKKTLNRDNPMNSREICEVSPEGIAAVYGGTDVWKRNVLSLECKSEGVIDSESGEEVVRMKQVSWRDHKAVIVRKGQVRSWLTKWVEFHVTAGSVTRTVDVFNTAVLVKAVATNGIDCHLMTDLTHDGSKRPTRNKLTLKRTLIYQNV